MRFLSLPDSRKDHVLDIEWIRQQIRRGNYELSGHVDDERQAERIPIADVGSALLKGEILEDYPNDPRGPSCLPRSEIKSQVTAALGRASEPRSEEGSAVKVAFLTDVHRVFRR